MATYCIKSDMVRQLYDYTYREFLFTSSYITSGCFTISLNCNFFQVCKRKPPIEKKFQGIYPSAFMSFRNVSFALLPKTGTTNILRMICITVGPKCTNITGYPDEYHYVPRYVYA